MKINKIKTIYEFKEKPFSIFVCYNQKSQTISLKTHDRHDKFWFEKSNPELVEKVGKLIMIAGKKFKELNK